MNLRNAIHRHAEHPCSARALGLAVVLVVIGGLGLLAGLGSLGATSPRRGVVHVAEPHLVVVKHSRRLYLFDGEQLVRTYRIDLGTAPAGPKQRRDDSRTPEGSYHIVTKNAASVHHRFLGIDYPQEEDVRRGLVAGLVSSGEAASLRAALATGGVPDWGTALGGGIGLHGGRRGHDWTGGCIALDDAHVEELFAVLRVGDPVEILP